ncbi:MAG: PQQ-binding-like beta-propeller repeat protein [Bacteroidota bacterium]
MRDYLYVATAGHVVAIDPQNGNEIWRTKIGTRSTVHFIIQDKQIIATVMGTIVALDAMTGTILWENKLPKLGYQHISLQLGEKSLQMPMISSM